jgi:hypothetical protein
VLKLLDAKHKILVLWIGQYAMPVGNATRLRFAVKVFEERMHVARRRTLLWNAIDKVLVLCQHTAGQQRRTKLARIVIDVVLDFATSGRIGDQVLVELDFLVENVDRISAAQTAHIRASFEQSAKHLGCFITLFLLQPKVTHPSRITFRHQQPRVESSSAKGHEVSAYRWDEDVADSFILSAGWLARPSLLRTARTIRSCAVDTNDGAKFLSLHIPRAENFVCDALEPLSTTSLLGRIDAIERRMQDLIDERQRIYREEIERLEASQIVLFEKLRTATADKHSVGNGDSEKSLAANRRVDKARAKLLRVREVIRTLLEAMLADTAVAKIYQKGWEQQQNVIERARRADSVLENATEKMRALELDARLRGEANN